MFKNREEAGKKLAEKLRKEVGGIKGKGIVLAIPRGGVVIGKILAQELNLPLKVLVIKKIGTPGNPELAAGAIGPDKMIVWNCEILNQLGLKEENFHEEIKSLTHQLIERAQKFKSGKPDLKGKIVILTDDGIATGATMEAAILWLKTKKPGKIILAVPVAPPEAIEKFKNLVDQIVFLETPAFFGAVGQFYQEFPQVEDEEVIRIIKSQKKN